MAADPSPPLEPSGEQARDWATRELSKARYDTRESLPSRVVHWITDRIGRTTGRVVGLSPTGVLLLAGLIVVALVAWSVWRTRRPESRTHRPDSGVLADPALTAADLRERAAAARARGDHDGEVLELFRAVVRGAYERTLLERAETATTREVTLALGTAFPGERTRLEHAAGVFDLVRYGHGHASAEQATQVRDVEADLRRSRPARPGQPDDVSFASGQPA